LIVWVIFDISLKISQVPVRPSLVITTGGVAVAPSSKSEIRPGLTAQPLRPGGGGTTVPPALPPLPLPAVPPLAPPAPAPALPTGIGTHALFVQVSLPAHTLPQTPQFWALLVRFVTHTPEQTVPEHVDEHTPLEQNALSVGHTLPHVPQFKTFDVRSVQTLLHLEAHCGPPEPPEPPAPGALPLPAVPGPVVGEPAEQLIASTAGNASVSRPPTNCARKELEFSRNRFHIRAPNLKFERSRSSATSAPLGLLHSAATVARRSVSESAQKSPLSLKLAFASHFNAWRGKNTS
jgi:hypothetical protein